MKRPLSVRQGRGLTAVLTAVLLLRDLQRLDVSEGIDLGDVPRRDDVQRLLDEGHFRIYA